MSRVLLTLEGEAQDTFALLEDGADFSREGDLLVRLPRFLQDEPALKARAGRLGVVLAPDDDAFLLEGKLEGVALIAVEFPSYRDGRGYTRARHVRENLAFRGELRAVGDISCDHVFPLRRCGFDSFLLREGEDKERATKALARYSVVYQPATWSP